MYICIRCKAYTGHYWDISIGCYTCLRCNLPYNPKISDKSKSHNGADPSLGYPRSNQTSQPASGNASNVATPISPSIPVVPKQACQYYHGPGLWGSHPPTVPMFPVWNSHSNAPSAPPPPPPPSHNPHFVQEQNVDAAPEAYTFLPHGLNLDGDPDDDPSSSSSSDASGSASSPDSIRHHILPLLDQST